MSTFGSSSTKIRDFIDSIENGKYRLPCFQRDFRWNPTKIKSLINSIQHVYPAGSLLFLKVARNNPLIPSEGFKGTDSTKFVDKDPEMLVLDGQQRMTSCYYAFTNKGPNTYYINYLKLMEKYKAGEKDIDFEPLIVHKKHNDNPVEQIKNGLFPMKYLKDGDILKGNIKTFVQDNQADKSKTEICNFLLFDFERIVNPILEYEFPIVELPETSTMEAVCKVFQTINTTGLKLSVFDICVAVFAPGKNGINLKEEVKKSSSAKKYIKPILDKDPTSVLQVIALLSNKQPNSNTLAKELTVTDIKNHWTDAIDGIEQTMALFDSFGAGTKKSIAILPYTPMIPIVAAVLSITKYSTQSVPVKAIIEKKLKTYFYTAALSCRYTEGTNSKINEDFKALNDWISVGNTPGMITHGVDWNTEKIIKNNKNSAFGKAVLCALNTLNPKDFYSQSKEVGVGENLESCDLHHIFPKAAYENNYKDTINSVFNFTWLIKDTNIFIQDDTTKTYINNILKNLSISEEQLKLVLKDHLIEGRVYEDLIKEQYDNFIVNRAEKVKAIFENFDVVFKDVKADEVEVEEDYEDEDEE